jgi:hypothetical protein
MNQCGFYACKQNATIPARFVNDKIVVDTVLCEAHDKFTKQGGQLALLLDRAVAPERQP